MESSSAGEAAWVLCGGPKHRRAIYNFLKIQKGNTQRPKGETEKHNDREHTGSSIGLKEKKKSHWGKS